MGSRLDLQIELEEILGSREVYFQPPESRKLTYDCIIYSRSNIDTRNADNLHYTNNKRYEVTMIYRNPDSDLTDRILNHFQYSSFERHFTNDNLNHDVVSIYY